MPAKADSRDATPVAELRALIERTDAKHQKLFRSVRAALGKRLPAANELVYDYATFFGITYSPTVKPYDAILTLSARTDGVRLYFLHGPQLPDPKQILRGTGKETRYVQKEAASQLGHADVEALIAAAIDRATVVMPSNGKGALIIKSTTAKKRARKAGK